MCTNGTQVPCEVPSLPNPTTRKGWPHHRGLRPPLFSNSDVGCFTFHKNKSVKVLWDGTYGFSSLSEKTRKSNHLQMSLQRLHFLLSYLKALSVGPAKVWIHDSPAADQCSPKWANQVVIKLMWTIGRHINRVLADISIHMSVECWPVGWVLVKCQSCTDWGIDQMLPWQLCNFTTELPAELNELMKRTQA